MDKISIIIPTHNRGEILGRTLFSYLNDQRVLEVIVVDDGSTDNTQEILREIAAREERVKFFRQDNRGAPAARNLGLTELSGNSQYVFFGEDDAFLEQDALGNLVHCLESTGADIAGGMIVPINSPDAALTRPTNLPKQVKPVNINLMRANFKQETEGAVEVPFMHALFLAKRWVFNDVRFDENYFGNAYREETDFCIEASRRGAQIMFCPESALYHIEAPQGGQRRISRLRYEYAVLKNNWYFLNKHYAYLRERYKVKTPKLLFQAILCGRRLYLLMRYLIK